MRKNRLGRSAVEVTELGFGGGPLGGLFAPLDDETAAEALTAAWDAGIRSFDTAPHYGIGHSERRIGASLRQQPRGSFTLSTKVGRLLVPQEPRGRRDEYFEVPATQRRVWDFSRDGVLRSVDASLARMGVDRVDVLFLHDAEDHFDAALQDGYPALAELRSQGVVGAIGAGMFDAAKLTTLVRETDVDVVMLAGRYTLLEQFALDDLLPACAERGVSVLAAAVFNSGVLAEPRPAAGARFDYQPAPPELLQRAHRIADVCEAHGVTLPQAAIAFPLAHPVVAGVVIGMRSAEEVRRNISSFDAAVPAEVWADLRGAGLLDERAPVPG
jgi:D-threo-aldose 1-dehydrogenase